jgi:ADP-ribose pyrophosphatase
MEFTTIRSEKVYTGRVFDVLLDQIRLPNGKLTELDIVQHPGAVTLVPVDRQGRLWMVRQYRHAARSELLELPAGSLEENEPPEACARREAREEIGMTADRLELIGQSYLAPGYSTEYMYIYLATELRADPLPADEDEFLSVEPLAVSEVYQMAASGGIQDSKTLAALFLARPYLSKFLGTDEE